MLLSNKNNQRCRRGPLIMELMDDHEEKTGTGKKRSFLSDL